MMIIFQALWAIDGTESFSSKASCCDNCRHRKLNNGKTNSFHNALNPVIVESGKERVISLEPEFIIPQDGNEKQDCELQAASALVATCVQNRQRLGLQFVLVNLVRAGENALRDLQDLACLTGAKLFDPQAGETLQSIQPAEMGYARYAEAVEERLTVSAGGGDPVLVQSQIADLQAYLDHLPLDDKGRGEVEMRIGRLAGRMGILKIGAGTHNEREVLRQKAEKGLRAVRAAQQAGVLPGGGTAYLHCIEPLEIIECASEDERMGVLVVSRALRRPFEQLLHNAGVEYPARLAHEITQSPPGLVFDVEEKELCPAAEIGLFDPARVLTIALETASSGAQMALSTEVIILKKNPRISYEP